MAFSWMLAPLYELCAPLFLHCYLSKAKALLHLFVENLLYIPGTGQEQREFKDEKGLVSDFEEEIGI